MPSVCQLCVRHRLSVYEFQGTSLGRLKVFFKNIITAFMSDTVGASSLNDTHIRGHNNLVSEDREQVCHI